MSDPSHFPTDSGGTAALPTIPPINSAANAVVDAIFEDDAAKEQGSPRPPSPGFGRPRGYTNQSSVSRVDPGYFDPSGVNELRRTMSQMSQTHPPRSAETRQDAKSDMTLAPFDLAKCLQDIIKR